MQSNAIGGPGFYTNGKQNENNFTKNVKHACECGAEGGENGFGTGVA